MTLTEFDLRLAALLGVPATKLKHVMPYREYRAWRVLEARWPIGWRREDLARARQTAVSANAWGGEYTVGHFLPPEAGMSREMDDEEIRAAGTRMATG